MIKGVDHIGVAVRSLEEAKKFYSEILQLPVSETMVLKERGVKIAFISQGETVIELLEPWGENSPITNFLTKRGEGLHHLAFRVEDLSQVIEVLKEKGMELIDQTPRPGAFGRRVAFLSPRSSYGVLIELCEEEENLESF